MRGIRPPSQILIEEFLRAWIPRGRFPLPFWHRLRREPKTIFFLPWLKRENDSLGGESLSHSRKRLIWMLERVPCSTWKYPLYQCLNSVGIFALLEGCSLCFSKRSSFAILYERDLYIVGGILFWFLFACVMQILHSQGWYTPYQLHACRGKL